jgi:uncharacterized lipoprotein YmbA
MKLLEHRVLAVLLAAVTAACAVSPAPTLYTLDRPLYRGPAEAVALPILVGPVTLPDTVDRASLMRSSPGQVLQPLPQARWAQALRTELSDALAAHLALALDQPRVTTLGLTLPSGRYRRLSIDFVQLEAKTEGTLRADVLWTLSEGQTGRELLTRRLSLDEPLGGHDAAAIASAHSRVVARLADSIAAAIKPLG